jgi:alpha-L-fucosidase
MLIPLLVAGLAQATSRTPEIAAWEHLKYGMFIHFSINTFNQIEIDDGSAPASKYNPTHLDVRQWIRVAKQAGMKYAVLTAKHTAGFCLWPSGDYDITKSPVKTDVVAEFMKACHAEGIKPGIYYCVLDGHNEGGIKWEAPVGPQYFALIKKHLTQLHTNYPGIFEQWIDIPGKLTPAQRRELYDLVKKLSPKCLVLMNESDWTHPGTTMPPGAWPTDLAVGERHSPPATHNPRMTVDAKTFYIPLEVCDTLAEEWFWLKGDQPRSLRRLYRIWQNSVGRGANLLLDVAPDLTGRIPQSSVKRLMELRDLIDHPVKLEESLTKGKVATASNVYHKDPKFSPAAAVDDDDTTRWACDENVHSAWLEVDLGKDQTFDHTMIAEAYPNRIQSFELQRKSRDSWVTFYRGTKLSREFTAKFEAIKARHVRLHVLKSTVGPTIWEFQLYAPAQSVRK